MVRTRFVVCLAALLVVAGCSTGAHNVVAGAPVPSESTSATAPASTTSTTANGALSPGAVQLENALNSDGDLVTDPVSVRGSFYLAPPAGGATSKFSRDDAVHAALGVPAVRAIDKVDTSSIRAKLALFSQGEPGASDLPEGASTAQTLVWVVLIARVADPGGGPTGGAPGPGVTTTTAAGPSIVDVVVFVDASTGLPGDTFVLG